VLATCWPFANPFAPALANPLSLCFNALTRAPSAPLARLFARVFTTNSRSFVSRFCVQNPSSTSKKSTRTGRSLANFRPEIPSMMPSRLSSAGRRQPSLRHAINRSLRYAPCSSRVRCCVSPKYASVHSGMAGNSAIYPAHRISGGPSLSQRQTNHEKLWRGEPLVPAIHLGLLVKTTLQ
jgi:hypothetical protein